MWLMLWALSRGCRYFVRVGGQGSINVGNNALQILPTVILRHPEQNPSVDGNSREMRLKAAIVSRIKDQELKYKVEDMNTMFRII